MLTPTWTLPEADALVPFLADHLGVLRAAVIRVRTIDEQLGRRPSNSGAPAGEGEAVAAADLDVDALRAERAALEAATADALAELWRVGASVRFEPTGVEVHALRGGEPVRLVYLDDSETFTLWRDGRGALHTIDDPDLFGPALPQ